MSVKDVVAALAMAMEREMKGFDLFNLASGQEMSVRDLLDCVFRLCKADVKPICQPARSGDIVRSLADITKMKNDLGFNPKYSFNEGLAETVEWLQSIRD